MNLIQKVRKMPKRFVALAALVVAGVATTAAMAWGPARQTYTVESPADHITFNSITNNPNVGDERNFVVVKDASNTAAGGWQDTITVQPGKEYLVRIYVHNNAATSLNLTAINTRVMAALGTNTGTSVAMTGYVSADNASQKQVWDDISFTSDKTFNMVYVKGSAIIYNNATGQTGRTVSDSIVDGSGALIGYTANDGKFPGCFQYAGYVTLKVKPQFAKTAEFTMDKQVRKHSSTTGGWVENYAAQPGETVDYIIRYKNTGETTMDNVVVKDTLPAGMTYVTGSTLMANSNYPNGTQVSDNVTKGGINIGSYTSGANAWVRFSAKVADNDKLPICGVNTLKNVGTVDTDYGNKSDDAVVTVTKKCEEKTITVCRLSDKVYPVTIKESEFDSSKYSKNPDDCKTPEPGTITVCRLSDKTYPVTIKESEFDSSKYSKNASDCDEEETPTEVPSTGPAELLGSLMGTSALGYGAYTYAASKKALRSARK